ncbi:TPA: hypothetical protein ACR3Z0_006557 [Bacillus thuringiensis]|uniref:Uncharacterized protein n=1 Tax=Bacillus thuringiensis TaxID=1428 RepID=A0A9X6KIC8_BACTU|nr:MULTISPECIES: hypothetical protein [Bacillus cereus group]ETE87565.1 hypothetical protein C623_0235420 [Bacillus thuringiensis serovar aizawai str. Hu4-2]ETE90282.1 hypothetical protein C621_0220815 [Bacillus thuringiensis serovar aizawai str. Leapi01]KAB1368625.1 hypothetical protein FPG93_32460 [Bacillus thuringiensis]KLA23085.1 hypothetical protein B4158_6096 [Bacillus cereus]KMQ07218.1 hypothetical protein TU66_22375 [Bacillus cereus]
MNLQIDEKNVATGQWVVCELKDNKVITQVKRVIKDTFNDKVELWGSWGCEGAIHSDWGYNHANKCRYATVEEIDAESVRRVFAQKGRKPNEYRSGDVVTDEVYASRVLHVIGDRATVQIMNSHQIYEAATDNLEILFFAEDMVG